MQNRTASIITLGLLLWCLSCSSSKPFIGSTGNPVPTDEYTTAFPSHNVSEELKDAKKSIIRILSTAYYNTYTFNRPIAKIEDIRANKLADIASQQFSSEESTAGTSIILDLKADGSALLITCAHAVTSPDTLISYFPKEKAVPNTFVKSISIKRKQSNLIFAPGNLSSFNVIAQNTLTDLALITTELTKETKANHKALPFTIGQTQYIQPGSFLYILGFPKGFPMITRGLASTRGIRPHHFFIMDAIFNPGISGGLIIGSRDNFNSFEWIGIARSATADKETVLIPNPSKKSYEQGTLEPYDGKVFVDRKNRISYGITQAVPIDEIRRFIENNQQAIRRRGFFYSTD